MLALAGVIFQCFGKTTGSHLWVKHFITSKATMDDAKYVIGAIWEAEIYEEA